MSTATLPTSYPPPPKAPLHPPSEPAAGDATDSSAPPAKKPRKRKKKNKAVDAEDAPTAAAAALSTPSTTFVEGLPYDMTPAELTEFLTNQGIPPTELRLPTWQDTGRLRGFGHVVFASKEAAKKAIDSVTGVSLPKYQRYLTFKAANVAKSVEMALARPQPKGCKSVFVKNLPYGATEASVKTAFSECGKVVDGGVRLPLVTPGAGAGDVNYGKIKGFGYVTVKEPESALVAVNKARGSGVTVEGRALFVDYDEKGEEGIKASFKMQDGRNYNKAFGDKTSGMKRKAGGPRL